MIRHNEKINYGVIPCEIQIIIGGKEKIKSTVSYSNHLKIRNNTIRI